MCGCESWTSKKDDEKRISAFEMKCLRQILRVLWMAKRTNEWVRETAGGVKKSTCVCERNETSIPWAYIVKERGLPGEGINTR